MNNPQWVFFDVDDVLTDTSSELERSLRRLTGIEKPIQTWTSHHFLEAYGLSEEGDAERMINAWREDQVLERSILYPEVKRAMDRVAQTHPVGLITARGWHQDGGRITEQLIKTHALPVSTLLVVDWTDSKAQVLHQQHRGAVKALVDDTFRHVEECHQLGIQTALMNRPWNQQYQAPGVRIQNLEEFAQWVCKPTSTTMGLDRKRGPR